MRKLIIIAVALAMACAAMATPSAHLQKALDRFAGVPGVGIAVITSQGDTAGVNADSVFALESVVKFYQAVALSHMLGDRLLTDSILVAKSDLKAGTWSPLRARYPAGGYYISPVSLLEYTMLMSDNNAADILFDRYGSPALIDSVLRRVSPARDFGLRYTEDEMHADPARCSSNHATPADAATLMHSFFCSDTTSMIVRAVMSQPTVFGATRLPAGLPAGRATIFHKTGTGFASEGGTGNTNDVGFVYYPRSDGSFGFYTIAVFLRDRKGAPEEAERLVAAISEAVWSAMQVADSDYALSGTQPAGKPNRPTPTVTDEGSLWLVPIGGAILEAILDNALGN